MHFHGLSPSPRARNPVEVYKLPWMRGPITNLPEFHRITIVLATTFNKRSRMFRKSSRSRRRSSIRSNNSRPSSSSRRQHALQPPMNRSRATSQAVMGRAARGSKAQRLLPDLEGGCGSAADLGHEKFKILLHAP